MMATLLQTHLRTHRDPHHAILNRFRQGLIHLLRWFIGHNRPVSEPQPVNGCCRSAKRDDPLTESLRECCRAAAWEQKLDQHLLSHKEMYIVDLGINPQCDMSRREAVRRLEHLLKRSDLQ